MTQARGNCTLLPLLTGEGRERRGVIAGEAAKLAEAGQLAPQLDPRRFTHSSVNGACRAFSASATRGKLVVDGAEENAQ